MSFAAGIKPLKNYETLSGSSRAEFLSHNALQDSAGIKKISWPELLLYTESILWYHTSCPQNLLLVANYAF